MSEPCPSDLTFDAMLGSELDSGRSAKVSQHLEHCARCTARFEALRRYRDAVESELLARIPLHAPKPAADGRRPLSLARSKPRRTYAFAGTALGLAAALLLWVNIGGIEPSDAGNGLQQSSKRGASTATRTKGAGRFGFFVKRNDAVLRGGPGDVLHPNDAIRFTYAAPTAGYLAVLGVDGAGQASVYYPDGDEAAPFPGGAETLDQSIILDGVLGRERWVAVFCEAPFELEPIRAALQTGRDTLPKLSGCHAESLMLEKRSP